MAVKIELDVKKKQLTVSEPESVSSLVNGYYGYMKKGTIHLFSEEALYLLDIRNASCNDTSLNTYRFNAVAALFPQKKQMARYFAYKDWRDRGLIARQTSEICECYGRNNAKKYPPGELKLDKYALQGRFYADDLWSIIDDEPVGKELYERYWLGQFGSYKAEQRGKLSKLDAYETLFLVRHAGMHLENAKEADVIRAARKQHKDFLHLYSVYEDWRLHGYVLKTGFKFGTHFRLYMPGASPVREGNEWIHSKHVIHCFPRSSKMLISEWARAIRVAHSVKKTFLLAIPGEAKKKKITGKKKETDNFRTTLDFLLYHRQHGGIENPKTGKPKYLMLSLSEEEYIGGEELAEAIAQCKRIGLELILAICDRETSVTYYAVKRVEVPGSKEEYYEIEWEQP
ncbi:MAG: tRNA-intron lyase [Candidatus Micrarchaeota archaeon]|nr:tRNA-intron lyase [Candidatus Micrarchaeota archaeon]